MYIVISLVLAACSHVPYQRETFSRVAAHELRPQEIFVQGKNLFIHYQLEGTPLWFVAALDKTKKVGAERVARLSVQAQEPSVENRLPVLLSDTQWQAILHKSIEALVPDQPNTGCVLVIYNVQTLLYRRSDGTPDLVPLNQVPPEVKIIGKIEAAVFSELVRQSLEESVANQDQTYTRFLLPLEKIALSPFLYIDTIKKQTIRLQLPEYYQVKIERRALRFSASFIYSFLIKSHLWSTLKAPFTTTHRLVAVTTSSLYSSFGPALRDLKEVPPLNVSGEEMDLAAFNSWLDKHISKQNYKARIQLLIDGEEFFAQWMLAMQHARESIFTTVYIFMADPYGLAMADIMKKRAAEGIDVRVIVDELNTVLNSSKNPELMPLADFIMPKYITSYLRKKSPAKARTHLNPWSTFDHSKVYIVDRKVAFTGGMNIGEAYRYIWHDMMVRLEGPVVGRLVKNFYQNWSFTGLGGDYGAAYRQLFSKKKREVNQEEPDMIDVRLMYTKPHESEIFAAQREAIRRAKKRIYIENAYFSDDRIVRDLIDARGRGVDVRVILPGENDFAIMDTNNRYMANRLLANGVRVYFYNGMSHVKAAVYDGWAVVGSANFDKMSLYVNKEMSLGVSDPVFVADLVTRLFEKDFTMSEEMTEPLELSWTAGLVTALTNQL